MNSMLSSQINQCDQIIQQLMNQTQQGTQTYQQLLQQEQQHAAKLQELSQHSQKAIQMIQQSLQGHQTAMQQLQHISQVTRQMEQSSMTTSFTPGMPAYNTGANSYNPAFNPSYGQQQPMHASTLSGSSYGSPMNQGRSFQ